jgi:pimeloyl-ACP methyl ester carboxylesterase
MSDQSPERPRRLLPAIGAAAVVALFLASLFLIFLTNRFNPTAAAERVPAPGPQGMSIVYLGDFAIAAKISGADRSRPPVILLLGGAGESGLGYLDRLGFLEATRQVLAYDPRGSGLSQVRPNLSLYTMSALTAELDAVVEHVAAAESVDVVAHGFGAALAVRYAREYPGRVARLVLLSPMPPDGVRYDSILDLLRETAGAVGTAGIPPSNPASADRWQDRLLLASEPAFARDTALARRLGVPRASFGTARALVTSLASSRQWREADVTPLPTHALVILGPRDRIPGILPRLFPDLRIVRAPDDPHPLILPRQTAIGDTILRFLDGPA